MRRMFLSLTLAALGSGLAAPSWAAPSWEGQIVYQVMPDRFWDGNAKDNAGVDKGDPRAWHGGDLAGLSAKLPYIADLGATALWLTPIYRQKSGTTDGTAGYHGYWPSDFRAVDSHFGSLQDFDSLVKTAHHAGLKVMLDQVINHFGYEAKAVREKPGWFHDPATCAEKGSRDIYCPLAGLPDLAQENGAVRAFLFGNGDFWRARGVDGFRYDAVKNVPPDFLKNLAARDARKNTYTLGEYFDADADVIGRYQQLGLDSLFDFSLRGAMADAVTGGQGLGGVRTALEQLSKVPRPGEVALFLDNHDLPRFASGSLFEDEGRERAVYGLRALMTLRGIPVIWQGGEIAMRGGADPDNRRDMRFKGQWTPQERATFEAVRKAIAARKASGALSQGSLKLQEVPAAQEDDLLLFTRERNGEKVLVAWNNAGQRATYSVRSSLKAAPARDLFGQDAGLSALGGFIHLSLPPRSAAAFELQ